MSRCPTHTFIFLCKLFLWGERKRCKERSVKERESSTGHPNVCPSDGRRPTISMNIFMAECPNCSSLRNRRSFHPWWPEAVGDRGKTVTTRDLCRRQEQACSVADMQHQCSPRVLTHFTACCSQADEDKPFSPTCVLSCSCVLCPLALYLTLLTWPTLVMVGVWSLETCHRWRQRLLPLQTLWCQWVHDAIGARLKWQKLGRTGTSMPQRNMRADAWCLPLVTSSALGLQLMQAVLTWSD